MCDWCGLTDPFRGGPVLPEPGPRGDNLCRMKTRMDLGTGEEGLFINRRLLVKPKGDSLLSFVKGKMCLVCVM